MSVETTRPDVDFLINLHQSLAAQSGGVVVLGGPRGVGKAALLSQARRELLARGRNVLFGRSEPASPLPYAALREPAAQAMAFLEARGIAEQFVDEYAAALGVLLPSLHAESGRRAYDKASFFESLRAFFLALARFGPLTLLLADMHYADQDTRDAVRFLAVHLFDPDVVGGDPTDSFSGILLLSTRTDDVDNQRFAESISQGRRSQLIEINGMSRSELLRYLDKHPSFLDKLLTATHGRPEDLEEIIEAIPNDVSVLLLQRVNSLNEHQRQILGVLAALGHPSPPDLIAAVLKMPTPHIAPWLVSLVEKKLLVRRIHNGELLFAWTRPHLQEALLAAMPSDERQQLHQAIGEALLLRQGGDGRDLEQTLAFYFLRGAQPQLGVPYAIQASEKLMLTFAYGTAVSLIEQALQHATDADMRFALLTQLVEAQRLRGELRQALIAAEDMRALAPAHKLPQVLRRIGELLALRGELRQSLDTLQQALSLADSTDSNDDLPEAALTLAALADAAYAKGDLAEADRAASLALTRAPRAPTAFQLHLANTRAKIAYSRDQIDEAETQFLANLRMAEANGLEREAILARTNAGLALSKRGQHTRARDILEKALSSAHAVGDLRSGACALQNLGAISQRTGDLGRALSYYRSALSLFSRLADRTEIRRATWNLANLYIAIGRIDEARQYLEQSRRLAESDNAQRARAFVFFTDGDISMEEGRSTAALASYQRARDIFASLSEHSRVAEMTVKMAWAGLALGDLELVQQCIDALHAQSLDGVAEARAIAVEGALLSLRPATVVRGLSMLEQSISQFAKYQSDEDQWRSMLFLAEQYEVRGDVKSAHDVRERAKVLVLRVADTLPPALQTQFLQDPLRANIINPSIPELPSSNGKGNTHTGQYQNQSPNHLPIFTDDKSLLRSSVENGVNDLKEQHDGKIDKVLPNHPVSHVYAAWSAERRKEWREKYPEIIGQSTALLKVFDRLDRIARSKQATVLVRGDSGTGKELVAAAVHRHSICAHGPFVRVNCAALVETLLLSELFGHEKGSFTGAHSRKIGRFELARGGTIFLDEIGDISPKTQVSLLRVLQERTFERVGGTQSVTTNAVVICATHRDLEAMVAAGTFREDLYYRLKGVVVELPALRDRPEDIPYLARHFLEKAREELGRAPHKISPAAEQILLRYRWPGNIREMQNVIRSVALFCEGDAVEVQHLMEFPELFDAQNFMQASISSSAISAGNPPPIPNGSSTTNGTAQDEHHPKDIQKDIQKDTQKDAHREIHRPEKLERSERYEKHESPPVVDSPKDALHPHDTQSDHLDKNENTEKYEYADAKADQKTDAKTDEESAHPTSAALRRLEGAGAASSLSLSDLKRRIEFEAIADAIRQTGGNVTKAAQLLNMKRPRLSQIVNSNPALKAIKDQCRGDVEGDEGDESAP